jgi:hypothetical protein
MQAQKLEDILASNPYPGRGLCMGTLKNGEPIMVYFIMGRSENSRNRVFIKTENGVATKAADESKLSDPSLIIYNPVIKYNNFTIVTNGNQTTTIEEHLKSGGTFESALRTREFEPDAPNFTPRISGILQECEGKYSYKLSILKSEGEGKVCQRFFYEYAQPIEGIGHFIHTYAQSENGLPSFEGEPVTILMPDDNNVENYANALWQSLNEDNKISLFVRSIAQNGEEKTYMFNKYYV